LSRYLGHTDGVIEKEAVRLLDGLPCTIKIHNKKGLQQEQMEALLRAQATHAGVLGLFESPSRLYVVLGRKEEGEGEDGEGEGEKAKEWIFVMGKWVEYVGEEGETREQKEALGVVTGSGRDDDMGGVAGAAACSAQGKQVGSGSGSDSERMSVVDRAYNYRQRRQVQVNLFKAKLTHALELSSAYSCAPHHSQASPPELAGTRSGEAYVGEREKRLEGEEPLFTNYTASFQGCLDYVFFTKDTLRVEGVGPLMTDREASSKSGLPSVSYPSDHILLSAELRFV